MDLLAVPLGVLLAVLPQSTAPDRREVWIYSTAGFYETEHPVPVSGPELTNLDELVGETRLTTLANDLGVIIEVCTGRELAFMPRTFEARMQECVSYGTATPALSRQP